MKVGLQIPEFTYPGGPAAIRDTLAAIARTAEESGFHTISVMDHLFQIPQIRPVDEDMLEAYTTLAFLAAHTERADLLVVVSAAGYRHPSVLAKMATTVDILSGGRTWLGLGAGWNDEEAVGLGLPWPPLKERFDQLEDALEVCLRMWGDGAEPFHGKQIRAERLMGVPKPLRRPHPPIMVGGGGEKKTLRLVAKYAQACNLFPGPDLPHKLEVLRGHCATEGTDYDAIVKTANYIFDLGPDGPGVDGAIADLKLLAEQGIQHVITGVPDFWELEPLRVIGREVIPAVADL